MNRKPGKCLRWLPVMNVISTGSLLLSLAGDMLLYGADPLRIAGTFIAFGLLGWCFSCVAPASRLAGESASMDDGILGYFIPMPAYVLDGGPMLPASG